MKFLWDTLVGLPGWLMILAVRCYQVCLSPALVCTRGDLDEIIGAIDRALTAQGS